MEVTGVLIDGIEIVGFQIKNARGQLAKIPQSKAFDLARQGKLDGVTVQSVVGTEYLAGIDYSALTHIPFSVVAGEIQEREDQEHYRAEMNGTHETITSRQAWNYTAGGVLDGATAGLLAVKDRSGKQSVIKYLDTGNRNTELMQEHK